MASNSSPRNLRVPSGINLVNLLFGGWSLLVLIFLYIPIVLLIVYSFNDSRLSFNWVGFTWKWYEVLLHNKPFIAAAQNSLIIATITTVISVMLGTSGAWLLYRYRFPAPRTIFTLIFVPMVMPELIMGISLLSLFAFMGVPRGFIPTIIGHITFCFPFVLVAVQARLQGLDPALEEAAQDLGATPIKAFLLVIVPYLMPAIISGTLMSFTLSLDELVVTYFTYDANSETLPIRVFGMARKGLDPSLNALSTLFIVATVGLMMFSEWLKRRKD